MNKLAFGLVTSGFFLLLMGGCGPSVETASDPEILTEIAISVPESAAAARAYGAFHEDMEVMELEMMKLDAGDVPAALTKLSDETFLLKIAMQAKNTYVRWRAVDMISNPTLLKTAQQSLTKIALEDVNHSVRHAAMKKLSDQSLVAKIALTDADAGIRRCAFEIVGHEGTLAALSGTCPEASLLLMINRGCDTIPEEHRQRWKNEVLTFVHALALPPIRAELGDVQDIQTKWEPRSATYYGGGQRTAKGGEAFTLAVRLSRVNRVVSRTWETRFEEWISRGDTRFAGAGNDSFFHWLEEEELLDGIVTLLSEATLAAVAVHERAASSLRCMAINRLDDQTSLKRIAERDNNPDLVEAARKRLHETPSR